MATAILARVEPPPSFAFDLVAARQGEPAAIERLAERFYPTVQRIVHHRLAFDLRSSKPWLATRFSTGDIVHDVLQKVLYDIRAFGGTTEEAFAGYLSIVIRNRIIDMVRHHEADCRDGRRTTQAEFGMNFAGPEADPASGFATEELRERLRQALDQLDERAQLLVRARIEGLATFAELAAQLGYETESGARRAFYAAQARLAVLLKDA